MCGIVGYVGEEKNSQELISCLRQLDYRGYDSCGIATTNGGPVSPRKAIGGPEKLGLEEPMTAGIAHTRWATHGEVSMKNAHPQCTGEIFVVHNGIISNHNKLRKELSEHLDCKFKSDTDTEVIAHTFKQFLHCNDVTKIRCTMDKLEGDFAFLILYQNKIFFAKNNCSLNIYKGHAGKYFSSSDLYGIDVNQKCILPDSCYGYMTTNNTFYHYQYDVNKRGVSWHSYNPRKVEYLSPEGTHNIKSVNNSFMHDEILEQQKVIKNTINNFPNQQAYEKLRDIDYIKIIGCGSSYNAGLVGKYLFEQSEIPCSVELSSEFNPVVPKNTLAIFISQSGETADTLEALRKSKDSGISKTLSICNNESQMSNLSDTIFTNVGIERGVASTKTFSSQVTVLYMLSCIAARKFNLDFHGLYNEIPEALRCLNANEVEMLANANTSFKKTAFMGGGIYYPLALEAALKFKELTYIPAQGYAGGEFKHGPISLADKDLMVYSLGNDENSSEELKSRHATVTYIGSGYDEEILRFFEKLVQVQLLAMFSCIRLGHNPDRPRNLAKSVTVK